MDPQPKKKKTKKVNPKKVISKSRVMKFSSDFKAHCSSNNGCEGWSTRGRYFTVTTASGKHDMRMSCSIHAPVDLTADLMRQTWAVSSTQDGYSLQS